MGSCRLLPRLPEIGSGTTDASPVSWGAGPAGGIGPERRWRCSPGSRPVRVAGSHHGRRPGRERKGLRDALTSSSSWWVQDLFLTETAKLGRRVLPACSWTEKVGTFTQPERRLQQLGRRRGSPGRVEAGLGRSSRPWRRRWGDLCTTLRPPIFSGRSVGPCRCTRTLPWEASAPERSPLAGAGTDLLSGPNGHENESSRRTVAVLLRNDVTRSAEIATLCRTRVEV